jgi:hypothetical protein
LIAGIALTVTIGVYLAVVKDAHAVVGVKRAYIKDTVLVGVGEALRLLTLCGALDRGVHRTRVGDRRYAVAVHVIIAGVAHTVTIEVGLSALDHRVGHIWARILGVEHLITVGIAVASVAYTITIAIELVGIGAVHTKVAGITYTVTIAIALIHVTHARTVILRVFDAIIIKVIGVLVGIAEVGVGDQN